MHRKTNTFDHSRKILLTLFLLIVLYSNISAQNFVKVTDTLNPIVTEPMSGNYFGSSWIDIDNDRLLDLYVNKKAVYKNLGGGNFIKLQALANQPNNLGNSWSDYNNDGLIDCFVVSTGATTSFLNKNEGNGIFSKVTTGEIGDSAFNTGWGCAWADYDNDGYTDLIIVAANGFGIVNHPNRLYHNNGDGTMSRVNFPGLTDTLAPFTIPTWSDYDQDGDMDLFIGTGPGGSASTDYLYRNTLTETGTAALVRLYLPPLTTDPADGQVWNLIDFDNDKDLDAFLTNYSSVPNRLYRNDGNGVYTRMTAAQVGNIVSDAGAFLANVWGDFDNDGDLDCFITRDGGQRSKYYSNNGNGTFTGKDSLAVVIQSGGNYGVSAGDYDNNGTLDLFVTGSTNSKGLFRNDLNSGNSWVNIKCIGAGAPGNRSNVSAIGTKVKAKATINGVPTWQYREILAQNSFNSMNMLNVHFGFGNATVIDSLVIIWTRGLKETYTNVQLNNFYIAPEGQGIVSGISGNGTFLPNGFVLEQNFPNPFNPVTKINYKLGSSEYVSLKIFDITGKEIRTLVSEKQPAGFYEVSFDGEGLSSGTYFYKLSAGSFFQTRMMMLIK